MRPNMPRRSQPASPSPGFLIQKDPLPALVCTASKSHTANFLHKVREAGPLDTPDAAVANGERVLTLGRDGIENVGELPRFLVAKVRERIEAVFQEIENAGARDFWRII
jgi:hypothetical protein